MFRQSKHLFLLGIVGGMNLTAGDRRHLDDKKQLIRRTEGLVESLIMSIVYYYVWRENYRIDFGPTYYGRGKVVLIFVYFVIIVLSFRLCEGSSPLSSAHPAG